MTGFSANIRETNLELTAKDRIKIKDTSNAISLDEATSTGNVVIKVAGYAILDVHNEHSDNKDYTKYVIVSADGIKYITGSESFFTSFIEISKEMESAGEMDYEIEVYRKDSKNYKGKQFITCSIV